jgi:hypothetical protein
MRLLRISIFAIVAISASLFSQTDSGHYYIMSYFKNVYAPSNDASGGFFALSTDGLNWTELNGGAPIIPPNPLGTFLCRDPYLYYDAPNGMFRYVYTTGWLDTMIGYAQITIADGKDFKNFQSWDQMDALGHRQIPIADKIPGASCTWAPEIFWDDIQNKYMIYWSTEIGNQGKRAYYVLTSDFKTFTNPIKFFDPGFAEIDGDLLKVADNLYYFFFKDERDESRDLHYITATNPQGKDSQGNDGKGWSAISPAITTLQGVEGPSSIKMNNEYRIYFDPYQTRINYRMLKSTDLQKWNDAGTIKAAGSNFVWSHCNVIEIPKNIYDWILTTKLSVRWNGKPSLPKYATGACFEAPGIYNLLGKKCASIYSWSRQDAVMLPAGFYLTIDKTKRVQNYMPLSK